MSDWVEDRSRIVIIGMGGGGKKNIYIYIIIK